jgi:ABC-type phosphate/phosphonate transport system permease subunit
MADAPSQQDEQQTEIILTIRQMKEQETRNSLRIQQLEESFDKITMPLCVLISWAIANLCLMIVLIIGLGAVAALVAAVIAFIIALVASRRSFRRSRLLYQGA